MNQHAPTGPARQPVRLRRTLPLMAIPAIAVLVAGCTGSASEPADGDPVSLTIASTTYFEKVLPELIDSYQEDHPNVEIEATFTPSADHAQVIGTQLSNGTASDIIGVSPGSASAQAVKTLAGQDFLVDLSDQPWVVNIPEDYVDYTTFDGKFYVPPISTIAIGAMYNMTELEARGLEIPRTWEEVLDFCDDAAASGTSAFGMAAATDYQNQMLSFVLEATLVGNDAPDFIEDRFAGNTTFADSPWVDVFEKQKELFDHGCFARDPLGTDITALQAMVAQGQALGYFGQSLQLTQLEALATDKKFVHTTFPATDDEDETRMSIALQGSFGVNAKTDPGKLDTAKDFLAFLMQPENVRKIAEATSSVPAIPDPEFKVSGPTEAQVEALESGNFTLVPDQFFPNPNVRLTWITMNQKMIAGDATPLELAEAMDAAWDER